MVRRLRWSAFGLRGRIVGAVLVTTVVTLGVAGLVLLPQLERSLRNASKNTLRNDVKDARGELRQLGHLTYSDIPELSNTSLSAESSEHREAAAENRALSGAIGTLETELGTANVTLFGFIDESGHGRPIGRDSSGEQGPDDDVAQAFFTRGKVYSFGSIGGQQVVRAAIPIGNDAVLAVRRSIDEIPGAVHAVQKAFAIAAIAGLLLVFLLAIPLAGTLVRRLQRLRQAALRVAVEGAGAEFPVDRARDEVGDLARSFAIMQRRLRHQEEARRAFVATASHELRTPLASLDGMLELLADDLHADTLDVADANELLERARVQSRRLGRLAADLLDLSRIDADVALRSEPVELSELARAVLAEFEVAMTDRGVGTVLPDGTGQVWARADPGSVARILRILVDNALRIAPRGSDVTVTLAARPTPTLSVIDRGPGVAQEERALIFERFKRGRDTGGEAGFGLGLAIGRELAERMGGALVLADSTGPGAVFTLTLPAASAPVSDSLASPAGIAGPYSDHR